MEDSKTSEHQKIQNPEAESDDGARFDKSLQELRDLCSQLHYAADYCETTFLNTKQKKDVMDNTREYICRAVVTVVDHLGSVSDNLDYQLSNNNAVSETELRIDCLKQRKSDSPIVARTSHEHEFEAEEEVPLFLYTYNHKACLAKDSTADTGAKERDPNTASVLPVRDGLSKLPKARNPFHFEGNCKHRSSSVKWKAVQNNDILALLRRSRKTR